MKPTHIAGIIAYGVAFESKFSLHIRERKSTEFDAMFEDVEYLERNMKEEYN